MQLRVNPDGVVHAVYDEALDLTILGDVCIRRASHVEPDARGQWWADLAPVHGPRLGPFPLRSTALLAEVKWLDQNWLAISLSEELAHSHDNQGGTRCPF